FDADVAFTLPSRPPRYSLSLPDALPIFLHRLGTLQAFGIPLPTSPAPQANGRVSGQTAAAQPSAVRPTVRPSGPAGSQVATAVRSEEHTSELQSRENLVCRLLLEKKKKI